AAYCPVGVDQPASRLRFLIEDTGAGAVVVDGAGAAAVAACGADVSLVPADGPGGEDTRPEPVALDADDLAYVMYTSGTTGRPKGVRVTHGNLAAYLDGLHRAHPGLAARRTLLATTMDTDFAVTVLHGALASGGSVVIADHRQALDGAALARVVREHGVQAVKFTPSHLAELLRTPLREEIGGLRAIVLGGEAVPALLAKELAALRAPDALLLNHYGPTETTVGVLTHRLDPDEDGTPPVGVPLPGVTVLVLDDELRPVPPGGTGVLWIGGPQVAAGYLGRPEATRAAFRTAPTGERIYRTGDLAFTDDRGRVHLRGRADDQVKVRGFRVEPGETLHVLLGLPGVRQADVLGHQGELVAFTVLDAAVTDPAAVRERLRALLPAHLVPDRLMALDRIPVAATGKADRHALRALLAADTGMSEVTGAAVGPVHGAGPGSGSGAPVGGGDLVEQVLQAWREVLRTPDVSLDQAFFEAGGSSLLLIRLLERLRALTERPLEVGDLFRHATVRSQAALLHDPVFAPPPLSVRVTPGAGGGDRSRLAARRRRTTPQRTSNRKASE
ncbi:amino acid adenylation domain-containing protein, partial [Streptomyces sp. CBMA370]|uniref:amino acid adenylation domain-containing protein n=1 Tax=Streptomyces sp. CBMA370 TaxID=1930278 RepID=UPI001661EF0F